MLDRISYLGFRFFIVGQKCGRFAIRDLEDSTTEYFSRTEVIRMSKIVNIMGISNGVIDVDWFKGWFAKLLMMYPEIPIEWTYHTGLGLYNNCFALVTNEYREPVNLDFVEFVSIYNVVNMLSNSTEPRDYGVLPVDIVRNILLGVGFRNLDIGRCRVCGSFPADLLSKYTIGMYYEDAFDRDVYISGNELAVSLDTLRSFNGNTSTRYILNVDNLYLPSIDVGMPMPQLSVIAQLYGLFIASSQLNYFRNYVSMYNPPKNLYLDDKFKLRFILESISYAASSQYSVYVCEASYNKKLNLKINKKNLMRNVLVIDCNVITSVYISNTEYVDFVILNYNKHVIQLRFSSEEVFTNIKKSTVGMSDYDFARYHGISRSEFARFSSIDK